MRVPVIRQLLARRHLAALLCAAMLLLKLLVPTGYMLDNDHGRITVTICSGMAPRTMTIAMPGMPDHGETQDHGRTEMPCAFSGLSATTLAAIDPALLLALVAFIMAIAIGGMPLPARSSPGHLRPPLRGPPIRL